MLSSLASSYLADGRACSSGEDGVNVDSSIPRGPRGPWTMEAAAEGVTSIGPNGGPGPLVEEG